MEFEWFLNEPTFAFSEGSIYERLRRHPAIEFDPCLAHATLINASIEVPRTQG